MVGAEDTTLTKDYPGAKLGPRLDLHGWEPHWTYAEIFQTKETKS